MRILLVNSYYYPEVYGGAEYSVKKLAEQLVKDGHEVSVMCTCESESVEETINGVRVFRVAVKNLGRRVDIEKNIHDYCLIKKWVYLYILYKKKLIYCIDTYNFLNKSKLQSILKLCSPDVVHTNGLYELTPIIWSIAKNNNIPVVHTLRDYYLLCIYGNKMKETMDDCTTPNMLCSLRRKINFNLLTKVDVVTSPSKATADEFVSAGAYIKNKCRIIPNAIDIDEKQLDMIFEKRKTKNNKIIKLVYIGTLSGFKGVDWLLKQFLDLKNKDKYELHFVGKGPLLETILNMSDNSNHLFYDGFLDENALNAFLSDMDLLVAPSLWAEPFGRIVLDAYKQCMPVVSSGYGGLGEIIEHKRTGYIMNMNKVDALQEALNFFSNNDNYINMLQNIRVYVNDFSLQKQADSFESLYRSLII